MQVGLRAFCWERMCTMKEPIIPNILMPTKYRYRIMRTKPISQKFSKGKARQESHRATCSQGWEAETLIHNSTMCVNGVLIYILFSVPAVNVKISAN